MDLGSKSNDFIAEEVELTSEPAERTPATLGSPELIAIELLRRSVTDAVRQVPTSKYREQLESELDAQGKFKKLNENKHIGLAQTVIGEYAQLGLNEVAMTAKTGITQFDPWHMPGTDLITLLAWLQQHRPEGIGGLAVRWQNQPDVVVSILGEQGLSNLTKLLGADTIARWMDRLS